MRRSPARPASPPTMSCWNGRRRATAIDRAAREVLTASGRRYPYDALVIATGCMVRELPQWPLGMPRVHYLRTEKDARALAAALRQSKHLLLIGGGLDRPRSRGLGQTSRRRDHGAGSRAAHPGACLRRTDRRFHRRQAPQPRRRNPHRHHDRACAADRRPVSTSRPMPERNFPRISSWSAPA